MSDNGAIFHAYCIGEVSIRIEVSFSLIWKVLWELLGPIFGRMIPIWKRLLMALQSEIEIFPPLLSKIKCNFMGSMRISMFNLSCIYYALSKFYFEFSWLFETKAYKFSRSFFLTNGLPHNDRKRCITLNMIYEFSALHFKVHLKKIMNSKISERFYHQ